MVKLVVHREMKRVRSGHQPVRQFHLATVLYLGKRALLVGGWFFVFCFDSIKVGCCSNPIFFNGNIHNFAFLLMLLMAHIPRPARVLPILTLLKQCLGSTQRLRVFGWTLKAAGADMDLPKCPRIKKNCEMARWKWSKELNWRLEMAVFKVSDGNAEPCGTKSFSFLVCKSVRQDKGLG